MCSCGGDDELCDNVDMAESDIESEDCSSDEDMDSIDSDDQSHCW